MGGCSQDLLAVCKTGDGNPGLLTSFLPLDFSPYSRLAVQGLRAAVAEQIPQQANSDKVRQSTCLVSLTTCKQFDIFSTRMICFSRIFKNSAFTENTQKIEMFTGNYLLSTYNMPC